MNIVGHHKEYGILQCGIPLQKKKDMGDVLKSVVFKLEMSAKMKKIGWEYGISDSLK